MNFKDLALGIRPITALVCLALPAFAQTPQATLGFGDPAPSLHVKWLKGEPIARFEKDRIYVVEFWATWCGPCRAVMPHLSELAQRLAGKVEIIGVNIWEEQKPTKAYSSFYPKVKEFVDKMGDRMAYHVAMDDDTLFMGKQWMEAARQQGIPATFIIKEGRIIFIGHPRKLDQTLNEILSGTYDMAAASREYDKDYKALYGPMNQLRDLTKDVDAALTQKDYAKGLRLVEEQMKAFPENMKNALEALRLRVLLHADPEKAIAGAEARKAVDGYFIYSVAAAIEAEEGLAPEAYVYGVKNYTEILRTPGIFAPPNYHSMASCFAKARNLTQAVATEEKAISLATEALAAGKAPANFNQEMIKNYQNALQVYRARCTEAGIKAVAEQVESRMETYLRSLAAGSEKKVTQPDPETFFADDIRTAEARLHAEQDPEIQAALRIALVAYRAGMNLSAKTGGLEELSRISPVSPAWAAGPSLLVLASSRLKDEAARKAFLDRAEAESPVPAIQEQLTFRTFILAHDENQEAVWRAKLQKLTEQFPGSESTKAAQKILKADSAVQIGKPAPAFDVIDLDNPGRHLTLDSYKGHYLLIDFWATWCGPCKAMLPTLERLHEKYGKRGLRILGIADDKGPEIVQAYRKASGPSMNWDLSVNIYDPKLGRHRNPIEDDYGIRALPTLVLLGPDGKVLAKGEELHQDLGAVLARFIPSAD